LHKDLEGLILQMGQVDHDAADKPLSTLVR
jgi:hypothetical protein